MCGVSVLLSLSLLVSAGFYCACASVNNVWDLQLSANVQQSERQNTKGYRLSFSWINKTVQGSFKPGGSCCITLLSRQHLIKAICRTSFLSFPPTLPASHIPHSNPQTTSALLLLIIGGLLTANSNWLGSIGLEGVGGESSTQKFSRSLPSPFPHRTPFLMLLGISHRGNCKYLAHLVRLARGLVVVSTNRKICVSKMDASV